ncbi:MAG: WD40/YVTN/BNR-like repeat-containing protein [Candidatus Thorarchaeota archaeon]|jgi:photosystem II stability/assembly factor-like uncharacterized protein
MYFQHRTSKIFSGILIVLLISHSNFSLVSSSPTENDSVWENLNHDFIRRHTLPWDILFRNETHGWVLSQNKTGFVDGMILYTDDGGDSWHLQYSNASQRFAQMFSIEETLWVTGVGGLFWSDDYGRNWSMRVIDPLNPFFYGVFFLNKTHGWTSSSGKMYQTIDSGSTWSLIPSWISNDTARMIHFISLNEGWAIGFNGIYRTLDGGESWEVRYGSGGWAMSFVSDIEAWAVADGWLAYMSDGATWVEQGSPRTSPFPPPLLPYYTDIQFLDANNGWIVGNEAEVIYTPNGGVDWYSQNFPDDKRLMAVYFINLTHGWTVAAEGYIYKTTQGNSLGSRMWTGITDPLIILSIGSICSIILVISGVAFYQRWKKNLRKFDMNNETLGIMLE